MDRTDRYRTYPRNFRPEVPFLKRLNPVQSLGKRLLSVEKPARYLGGEQGATRKEGPLYTIALCFPDLYEIGMSNNAIRILYSSLNEIPSIRCERVFAPALDFEKLLRDTKIPLYTLENHIPLHEVDIVAFSIGYELCATNILTVLDLGGIPLRSSDRGKQAPIVIAGGPATTNPHPFATFLDAVWIGEAEQGFFTLAEELARLKKEGANRDDLLSRMRRENAFWMSGKKAYRAIDASFHERVYSLSFPWPSIKPVQDHGTVEIMRGCPNGCRFCHAGYFYRPQRVRSPQTIFQEVEQLVVLHGYREITLASLSSGDYPELLSLIQELNRKWAPQHVSFQLPSLKVESFTLPILAELAQTRKSGLTFAVETPEESWQRSINKIATLEKILSILEEARVHGYKLAKFYFMLGLPVSSTRETETESLITFIRKLLNGSSFQFHINIGTFIPKPHTPFQWSRQIDESEAFSSIQIIREAFRFERRLKISYHSPFVSTIEGFLSRGDERAGDILFDAWSRGARLDAWEDKLNTEAWRQAFSESPFNLVSETLGKRDENNPLPWDDVSIRVEKSFLLKELSRSSNGETSQACTQNCTSPCGTCNKRDTTVHNKINTIIPDEIKPLPLTCPPMALSSAILESNPRYRMVFRFQKTAPSSFLAHRRLIETFYRSVQLSNLPVAFSNGFNPLPKLEIEDPLPLGIESLDDYFSLHFLEETGSQKAVDLLNNYLPLGLKILEAFSVPILKGKKLRSLSSVYWGSDYLFKGVNENHLNILKTVLSDPRLIGSSVHVEENIDNNLIVIFLRLKSVGTREIGFGAVFEKVFGVPFAQSPVQVSRIRQWSDVGSGLVSVQQALTTAE